MASTEHAQGKSVTACILDKFPSTAQVTGGRTRDILITGDRRSGRTERMIRYAAGAAAVTEPGLVMILARTPADRRQIVQRLASALHELQVTEPHRAAERIVCTHRDQLRGRNAKLCLVETDW